MIPVKLKFLGTYYIYLARNNVTPRRKVGLATALKLDCKSLHLLTSVSKDEIEWSAAAAELNWIIQHHQRKDNPQSGLKALCRLVDSRLYQRKPLQFILGTEYFNELLLFVKPPVLVPRWETAEWCEWLLLKIRDSKANISTILEFGSGTGCISLYFAHHLPQATVYSIDINPRSVQLANKNKKSLGLKNVHFSCDDLFSELSSLREVEGKVDLIVSNPPYIPSNKPEDVDLSVMEWEDPNALFSADFGTFHQRRILDISRKYLRNLSSNTSVQVPRIVLEIDGNDNSKQRELLEVYSERYSYRTMFHLDTAQKYRYASFW